MAGRVELTALLAFGGRELGEEVLVHAAEDVPCAVRRAAETDVAHEVDQLGQAGLVETGASEVLRQDALEGGVLALDGVHGIVDRAADRRLWGVRLEVGPAGLARDPEDAGGLVLVGVLGVGAFGSGGRGGQLGVLGIERVADVLEEDEPEHDVLVLGGVHVVTQGIGGLPELGFEAVGGAGGRSGTGRSLA